jgi:hypothetical protein
MFGEFLMLTAALNKNDLPLASRCLGEEALKVVDEVLAIGDEVN